MSQINHENFPQALEALIDDVQIIKKALLAKSENTQSNTESQQQYLSTTKALAYLASLGVERSRSYFYKLTHKKRIPFKKMGHKLLFTKHDLQEWVNSSIDAEGNEIIEKNSESVNAVAKSARNKKSIIIKI